MQTEWKQMLQDSGITEDLSMLSRENASGLKGKWSKINILNVKLIIQCQGGFHSNIFFDINF